MKLNDLKKAAAKAQQDLQLAERKAGDLQRKAKAAKAKSEQTRLEHKGARKSAKQAKKLALAAEDQAREQRWVLEKVQKRLAKTLKKLGQGKAKQKAKPARRRPRSGREPNIPPLRQRPRIPQPAVRLRRQPPGASHPHRSFPRFELRGFCSRNVTLLLPDRRGFVTCLAHAFLWGGLLRTD
jgi:hypothetical protein